MTYLWLLLLPPAYLLLVAVIRWCVAKQYLADRERSVRYMTADEHAACRAALRDSVTVVESDIENTKVRTGAMDDY